MFIKTFGCFKFVSNDKRSQTFSQPSQIDSDQKIVVRSYIQSPSIYLLLNKQPDGK